MTNPPPLPEMPPIKAAPLQPAPDGRTLSGQTREKPVGGRRLRQIVSAVTGGGFIIALGVIGLEMVLPESVRPTTALAMIEARTELVARNIMLGAEPGQTLYTEDEVRQRIAEAERRGQLSAEADYQEKLAKIEAEKAILIGAYQSLYQRVTIIVQAAVQLEAQAQQLRAQLVRDTGGGRSVVIGMKDRDIHWTESARQVVEALRLRGRANNNLVLEDGFLL